jgi:hypothetical protein
MQSDFDQLAKKAYAPERTTDDLDQLWAALFLLEEWYFIMQGDMDSPYPMMADVKGTPMILCFTDTTKVENAAKTLTISQNNNKIFILSLPVISILDYLEKFEPHTGIWFNSADQGFFVPIANLRKILSHLEDRNMI